MYLSSSWTISRGVSDGHGESISEHFDGAVVIRIDTDVAPQSRERFFDDCSCVEIGIFEQRARSRLCVGAA